MLLRLTSTQYYTCCIIFNPNTADIRAEGSLPCLSLAESEFSSLPTRCLQPEVSMSPLAFLNSSCQLAQHLGLQLPLVAGEALLLRQVQELALPQVWGEEVQC
jgi:hypothetical protein